MFDIQIKWFIFAVVYKIINIIYNYWEDKKIRISETSITGTVKNFEENNILVKTVQKKVKLRIKFH